MPSPTGRSPACHCLPHGFDRHPENFLGIVLDPAGLGIVLGELAIAAAQHRAVLVDDQGGGAGGSLVEREDRDHERLRKIHHEGTKGTKDTKRRIKIPSAHTDLEEQQTKTTGKQMIK